MMLWPVKLYTATNPRTSQAYQCRLDDMVVVYKVALFYLIVCHLYPSSKFWQNHHLDVFVLKPYCEILYIFLLITYRLYHRIWIYHSTRPLIDSLFQKHWTLLWFTNLVSRNGNQLSPRFNHNSISFLSYYFFINSSSNCSRLLPFVSGNLAIKNTKPTRHTRLYIQNVP